VRASRDGIGGLCGEGSRELPENFRGGLFFGFGLAGEDFVFSLHEVGEVFDFGHGGGGPACPVDLDGAFGAADAVADVAVESFDGELCDEFFAHGQAEDWLFGVGHEVGHGFGGWAVGGVEGVFDGPLPGVAVPDDIFFDAFVGFEAFEEGVEQVDVLLFLDGHELLEGGRVPAVFPSGAGGFSGFGGHGGVS